MASINISCFGPAPTPGLPIIPVDIVVKLANGSIAYFTLFRMPGSVVEARNPADPPDPYDSGRWSVTPPQNPQDYNLQITPGNVAGGATDAEISITQGGHVLPAFDEHNNSLPQPVKFGSLPNGVASTADIWINLP
jgi:hypothetical protein